MCAKYMTAYWKDYKDYLPLLTKEQKSKLDVFFSALLNEAAPRGFIGKGDKETLWLRHILDSLLILTSSIKFGEKIVDLGTGAGLPGIPLAIVMLSVKKTRNANFLLIDSSQKKIAFLEKIRKKISLGNTTIYASNAALVSHAKTEPPKKEFEKHDTVVFRAFQKPLASFELALNHLKLGGNMIYWRSKPFLPPKEENPQVHAKMIHRLNELGIRVLEHISLKAPEKLGNRGAYLIKREKKSSIKFPRPLDEILNDPICRL